MIQKISAIFLNIYGNINKISKSKRVFNYNFKIFYQIFLFTQFRHLSPSFKIYRFIFKNTSSLSSWSMDRYVS